MFQTLGISRRGFVEIYGPVKDDVNQCMNRGDREIEYVVEIATDPEALNDKGFIIDRHDIANYFTRKYGRGIEVLPSCEVMSKEAALYFAELLGPRCQKVTAVVGGALAIWERPNH